MFSSIKTNKLLRDTGFPSLKVIKNLELLCLYFIFAQGNKLYSDISLLVWVYRNLIVIY